MKKIILILLVLTFSMNLNAQDLSIGEVYASENLDVENVSFNGMYPTSYFRVENIIDDKVYVRYKLKEPFMSIIFEDVNGVYQSTTNMFIAPFGRTRLLCKLYIVESSTGKKITLKTYDSNNNLVHQQIYNHTHTDFINRTLSDNVYYSEDGFSPFE